MRQTAPAVRLPGRDCKRSLAFAAPRAFALSLERDNADAESLYFGHCSANNQYHAELVAELTAKLQGHTQAEIEAALAAARCPICGCPIA